MFYFFERYLSAHLAFGIAFLQRSAGEALGDCTEESGIDMTPHMTPVIDTIESALAPLASFELVSPFNTHLRSHRPPHLAEYNEMEQSDSIHPLAVSMA